ESSSVGNQPRALSLLVLVSVSPHAGGTLAGTPGRNRGAKWPTAHGPALAEGRAKDSRAA
ncbi:MAG: hypothetical protein ACRET5_08605, partial [Steroidobacteraceae bacterium]